MKGKKVLITGAGKGIGRGIALAFARTGAKLFLHYRSNPEEAQSLLDEVKALGADGIICRADLAKMSDLDAMFETVKEKFGTLDAAVNNAGWDPGAVAPEEIDEARIDEHYTEFLLNDGHLWTSFSSPQGVEIRMRRLAES